MAIVDTYSKRRRASENGAPASPIHDELPDHLRRQLWMIFEDSVGPYQELHIGYERSPIKDANDVWERVRTIMLKEVALFHYDDDPRKAAGLACQKFLLSHQGVDEVLDLVEVVCQFLAREASRHRRDTNSDAIRRGATQHPGAAIDEINGRFQEAGVGYRFGNDRIIKIDSELQHVDVMAPALALLREPRFKAANQEFMQAHAHNRSGHKKDATTRANAAVESTLKTICKDLGWEYPKGARASDLIKVVVKEGLFPEEYIGEKRLAQVVALLKGLLPSVRDSAGGHGSAPGDPEIPDYLPDYALNMAAATILMLIRAYKSHPDTP